MWCAICGGSSFSDKPVIWDALATEWQLAPHERIYIDRQQGTTCNGCGCNLRSIALADAVREAVGTNATLQQFTQLRAPPDFDVLEVNEAGNLSPFLRHLPRHVFVSYPAVDLQALPHQADSFDLIIHSDTLEHVFQPLLALSECYRVLRPGGAVCFTIPIIVERLSRSRAGLPTSYHGSPSSGADDYKVHTEFGADAWTYLMKAGFESVRLNTIDYPSAIAISAKKPCQLRRQTVIETTDFLTSAAKLRNKYLNILEGSLTGALHGDPPIDHWSGGQYDHSKRLLGRDWPGLAQTMIGTIRMRNLRQLCEAAILNDVPGDFIETGVWRGGACIYMRGILDAWGDSHRRVFVADSFMGLPPPNPETYAADIGDDHHTHRQLAVSRMDVEENFRRYGLLDDRVVFLEGWFKDTLPTAPIKRLAVLRLDGDMYESTIQALNALYCRVSRGGAVIVDDYFLKPCAQAVDEFRAQNKITAPLVPIDGWAVWWQVDHEPKDSQ